MLNSSQEKLGKTLKGACSTDYRNPPHIRRRATQTSQPSRKESRPRRFVQASWRHVLSSMPVWFSEKWHSIFVLRPGISVLAECLDCPELKATADDFIHQHFTEVYKTDEFLQLDVKRVTHLLNQDTLTVRAEDQVTTLPSHIFLSKNVVIDFLCFVVGYMTRKRILLGENVFFFFYITQCSKVCFIRKLSLGCL